MDNSHRRSASTSFKHTVPPTARRPKINAHPSNIELPASHDAPKVEQPASDGSDMTSSDEFELGDMDSDHGLEDDEETGLTSTDRRQRRKRKRRERMLGERVATSANTREEELRIANSSFWSAVIMNSILIGLWYLFSIAITVYNKWMFQSDDTEAKIVFPFPLFTTCVHMIVQFSLASLVLFFFPRFRPRNNSNNPHQIEGRHTESDSSESKKPLMTKAFYFTRIGPCGAATGLDIGLGNMSLKFISMTFYTMCKSSVLGFVLVFAFLFRLEKPSWRLFAIITTMTVGVLLMVAGETAFNTLGFILVMTAAASSGFRWSLTQILLLRNPATSNPFATVFYLAPVMFVTLLIIAVPVEGIAPVREAFSHMASERGTVLSAGILLFPGCLAFFMTASEFALLQRTSVVTLSICGIFKEVLTITTATIVFNDKLTPINFGGLVVTILTIAAYNYMKIKKMRADAKSEAHFLVEQGYAPVRPSEEEVEASADAAGHRRRVSTGDAGHNAAARLSTSGYPIRSESPPRNSSVKRAGNLD